MGEIMRKHLLFSMMMLLATSATASVARAQKQTSTVAPATVTSESTLLGSWQCDSILHASLYESDNSRFMSGWAPDNDGLTVTLKGTRLDFKQTGAEFSVTSSAPNPFVISSDKAVESPFRVIAGQLVLRYFGEVANYFYEIRQVDAQHLELVPQSGTTYPTLVCDRPSASASTVASAAGPSPTTQNTNGKAKPK
jgi:hypothetical protein